MLSDNGLLDDSNQVIDVPCHTVLHIEAGIIPCGVGRVTIASERHGIIEINNDFNVNNPDFL